ncbi:MAG: DMT family transporter [Alphaproteobacteria bacterium]|nr:DMT family transporter [Alphaproteobacteria bacterium]
MTAAQQKFGTGVFYVLLANLGWSLSGLFVRLMPSLSGWQINCWRGFWMATALLVYAVLIHGRHTGRIFKVIPGYAMLWSAVCFAAGTTIYVVSLTLNTTAAVSVIGATSPLVTGLLSPWITGEKPGLLNWLAALIAVAGTAVIGWNGFSSGQIWALALCFGVPFTFAIQTLLLRRYRDIDMMPSICAGGFLSFVVAGLVSLSGFAGASAFDLSQHDFLLLMLMGPLQLSIPLIFYGMGARSVPAITLSLLAMMDALINPFWSWAFAGEVPDKYSVIGGGIILLAVLLSVLAQQWFQYKQIGQAVSDQLH